MKWNFRDVESALQSDVTKTLEVQTKHDNRFADRRLLRSSIPDKSHTEDRMGGGLIFEKLRNVFTKGVPEKLQMWLKEERPAEIVFKALHFDQPGYPFAQAHFAAWVEYANTLSTKFPDMPAISILTKQYGDNKLYKIIKYAKRDAHTKALAIELETKQMQRWFATEKDPAEVFRVFDLHLNWRDMFDSREFITWTKYVDDLNTKHPEDPIWMYSTLTKHFDDEDLLSMTNVKKNGQKSKAMATKVENDWFQANLQKHKTPFEVFKALGLRKTTDKLLVNVVSETALAGTWVKYMEAFNSRYPDKKTTTIKTLTKAFGDFEVVKMLNAAKLKGSVEDFVAELEFAQQKLWLEKRKTIDDVFNLLQLDNEVIVFRPRDYSFFTRWVSYINAVITENPTKKDAVFSGLQARFNDKALETIISEAKKYPNMKNIANEIRTEKISI
ncbi:hypothetical protein PHMEG_00011931 [Phytophthora megakarya]|uniref:RxLR effector PexRD54 WY domain-containing protein n=1 Tax=Phytophthora megakarya TaxID=4795 RepID=A0A225WB05_9STRA|nr:hypothetical protein PHMEG_00011931 [Phytophthora megakarya]